jgi:hypothetical protein
MVSARHTGFHRNDDRRQEAYSPTAFHGTAASRRWAGHNRKASLIPPSISPVRIRPDKYSHSAPRLRYSPYFISIGSTLEKETDLPPMYFAQGDWEILPTPAPLQRHPRSRFRGGPFKRWCNIPPREATFPRKRPSFQVVSDRRNRQWRFSTAVTPHLPHQT